MNRRNFAAIAALAAMAAPLKAAAQGIDETINTVIGTATGPFVNFIFAPFPGTTFPWIVGWLVVGATVFTFYFGFIQLKGFAHAIGLVKGDYSNPEDEGEVSHFQALATALSGTVGLGNIAGVAVAVSIGGPSRVFWAWHPSSPNARWASNTATSTLTAPCRVARCII